jgi:hypothetical protein
LVKRTRASVIVCDLSLAAQPAKLEAPRKLADENHRPNCRIEGKLRQVKMAEIVGLDSMAQVKKHLGKAEVVSSILTGSTISPA